MNRMSKDELAELQDPESWEDAEDAVRPPVKSPRAVVSVAFNREDFERVAEFARQQDMKISEFIRHAALEQVSPRRDSAVVSVSGRVFTGYAAIAAPRVKVDVKTPQPPVLATA